MQIPVIRGLIDRRILVNYRVRPEALCRVLPEPFRPLLVGGMGMAGICLIRLTEIRPRLVPKWMGLASENAAHRIAVEWDSDGRRCEGVYIPRRDTSSRINRLLGGRLFPGYQHHAIFKVREEDGRFQISLDSDDGRTHLAVDARVAEQLPSRSVFRSLDEASDFFHHGGLGYSATPAPGVFDATELKSFSWAVEPLEITRAESSFFEDSKRFPPGSVEFDSALLMRRIEHEWHGREPLTACPTCCG